MPPPGKKHPGRSTKVNRPRPGHELLAVPVPDARLGRLFPYAASVVWTKDVVRFFKVVTDGRKVPLAVPFFPDEMP